jgi:type II secretory ATPase GspE/PulE/Tfp pilus assembly ATPase PilB-like protein
MFSKIKEIFEKKTSKVLQKKEEEKSENKKSLFEKLYDVADEKEKRQIEYLKNENFSNIVEKLAHLSSLHEKFIKYYYKEFPYFNSLKDFQKNFRIVTLQNGELDKELKEKRAILARYKKDGKIYLLLFIPVFNFKNKFDFDRIGFIGAEIINYFFKQTLTIENVEKKLTLNSLLQYMEDENINDLHIRGINENTYTITGRIGQNVIKITENKPASIIEDLILQLKLAMNKDTATVKPEDTGFVKQMVVTEEGITIERSYRVNLAMTSKIHSQVYSVSIRRLMTIEEITSKGLEGLGYIPRGIELIRKIQKRLRGISIIAGKTNSGKSTLLACILDELYHAEIKENASTREEMRVISIENPVEIVAEYDQIDLSVTENADEDKKMTPVRAMKAILRHDPDVVLVGEVRSNEDIRHFLELSLTGTNTFTTLHAGDVKTAILRLIKATDNPLDVLTNLNGVIAQSLVSKACQHCKGTGKVDGKICPVCKGIGIDKKGRVPIYEIAYFKRLDVSQFINEKNEIELKKFFDFKNLIKTGQMEYISKTEVAKYHLDRGNITETDYLLIKENEESIDIDSQIDQYENKKNKKEKNE